MPRKPSRIDNRKKSPVNKLRSIKVGASSSNSSSSPEVEFNKALSLLKRFFAIKLVRIFILTLLAVLLAPIILFFILRPEIQPDINYGVTFSKKYATELGLDWRKSYLNILDDLGAKNVRLVVYWDDVEKVRDEYDYSDILWQLDEAEKRNVNIILTLGRKVPRWPECFEPKWWKDISDEGKRNSELFQYVRVTVEALKDYKSIKMWQVENEPFFPFGECLDIKKYQVENEVSIVREIDPRPILIQDSGEGGFWLPSYKMGDYLAISMYRKIWYDFWGVFFGRFIYFQYPLAHWTYRIKADLVGVPYSKILVTELQAEPWGPGINSSLSQEEKDKSMSKNDFFSTIIYAQKAGFKDLYFWGVEWWLWEKVRNNNPFYWDTAKALFNQSGR